MSNLTPFGFGGSPAWNPNELHKFPKKAEKFMIPHHTNSPLRSLKFCAKVLRLCSLQNLGVSKMTRLGLVSISILLLLNRCTADERPPGVLSREQYTALLIEVYLTEAKLSQLPIASDSTMRLYLAHEPELLQKFGLTDSTLKLTYQYYISHPTEMEKVYAAVVDTLSLREQKANTSEP